MKKYALILAGGDGKRLWPLSRQKKPKQFLKLNSEMTLLEITINRLSDIIEMDNIYIITNRKYQRMTKKIASRYIPNSNIILEPEAKNTATCITYASIRINEENGDGIIVVCASDHYIKDNDKFSDTINKAIATASKTDNICLIGIKPTYPSEKFGYIKYGNNSKKEIFDVDEFKEKPNFENACKYLETGNYVWNSGIFVSKLTVLINSINKQAPILCEQLSNINNSNQLKIAYSNINSISFDYAVLEKTKNLKMILADFIWMDIGSLDSLEKIYSKTRGNVCIGNILNLETDNCFIYTNNNLVVTYGLKDIIIIENDGITYVCARDKINHTEDVLRNLKDNSKDKFL